MILIIFNSSWSQSSVPLNLPPWTWVWQVSAGFCFPYSLDHQNPWEAPLHKSEILWKEKALCAVILPFKMCLAQRLSTILLLRFTFCDGWPFLVSSRTRLCSGLGLLQHTVNNEVLPLARLSFYENLLIRQETIVRCSHSLRSWWFFGEFFSV